MANANFPLVQLSHHHVTASQVWFQHVRVAMLKTFMCGYSCMMTFLHLKLHNGQCKFSIGLCHCILGLVSTCKGGYAQNIYAQTFMSEDLSALKSVQWPMQIFHWFSLPITMSLHPRFSFNMHVWLCLIHLCMDI